MWFSNIQMKNIISILHPPQHYKIDKWNLFGLCWEIKVHLRSRILPNCSCKEMITLKCCNDFSDRNLRKRRIPFSQTKHLLSIYPFMRISKRQLKQTMPTSYVIWKKRTYFDLQYDIVPPCMCMYKNVLPKINGGKPRRKKTFFRTIPLYSTCVPSA